MMRIGVIYGLFCLECDPLKVRYVGKTIQNPRDRLTRHKLDARKGSPYPVHRWIRKHIDHGINVETLMQAPEERLSSLEVKEISLRRSKGEADLNLRDGGEGFTSKTASDLWASPGHRDKISAKRHIIDAATSRRLKEQWKDVQYREKQVAASKGPNPKKALKGSSNGNSKITEKDVKEIRQRVAEGEYASYIAPEYGISQSMISLIVRKESWRHVV